MKQALGKASKKSDFYHFGSDPVATIAVLNFFKDTLEGLSVELDLYFEDGTNDDVNN